MADTSGNIGYALLSASPIRGNEYPYLGCRVLDGTTSSHDWQGIVGMDSLPIVLNPAKGYYMTANHRVVPENSKLDIGATMISTGRSLRIQEVIEKGIREGKKFDAQDMVNLQQDMVDVIARDLKPHIIKIAENALST
jgi:penicillin amidase